jgi:hypothetical protein
MRETLSCLSAQPPDLATATAAHSPRSRAACACGPEHRSRLYAPSARRRRDPSSRVIDDRFVAVLSQPAVENHTAAGGSTTPYTPRRYRRAGGGGGGGGHPGVRGRATPHRSPRRDANSLP